MEPYLLTAIATLAGVITSLWFVNRKYEDRTWKQLQEYEREAKRTARREKVLLVAVIKFLDAHATGDSETVTKAAASGMHLAKKQLDHLNHLEHHNGTGHRKRPSDPPPTLQKAS